MADAARNVIAPSSDGTSPARPGYDHDWFEWEPIPARRPLLWPEGGGLAVSVVVNLGAVEWEEEGSGPVPPPGGRGIGAYPDIPRMSNREFGHRVGVFRLLEIAARLGIPLAAAVDVLTAEHYPALMAHLVPAADEVVAAGLSASRPITSLMSSDEEVDYVALTLSRLEERLGFRPAGWISPENSQSARTPAVLAGAGLRYMADWCNDDQPCALGESARGLWSFPLSWELSDLSAMFVRGVSPADYTASIIEAALVLAAEGATGSGRLLGLHVHPWVSGQAFRSGALEAALGRLREESGVWFATPGQIVDWCRQSP